MLLTILSGTIAFSIQAFDDQLTNCPKDVRPYSPHNLNQQDINLAATGFWTWPVEGNKGVSSNEVFVFSVCTCCTEILFLKMDQKKFDLFVIEEICKVNKPNMPWL